MFERKENTFRMFAIHVCQKQIFGTEACIVQRRMIPVPVELLMFGAVSCN
jgi:hypothetical protein